ncbi:hypothetical protein EDC01DRAFT_716088 [Geopyxis carbonaria]|nr:hypothetical protein EDC01DRAFT_716088 [Geopyxis carbonaria]
MTFFVVALFLYIFLTGDASARSGQMAGGLHAAQDLYRRQACPDYKDYSTRRHPPYTEGLYAVPYQRPAEQCRLFKSDAVEKKIKDFVSRMTDPALARLFENCFPNTLDTTVRWHLPADKAKDVQSFIVTGDINAQWLRDSTNQLTQYQSLAKEDPALKKLLLGAINTQVDFVLQSPYCNAFQPPIASGLAPTSNGQDDVVHPAYDPDVVFECKYEIDSLASFLSLANQYYTNTGDSSFVTDKYLEAVDVVMQVIEEQSVGTFSASGDANDMTYTFQRQTDLGTETLNLRGIGNPLASNTSLVRSAFRPSDDAAIMQFFIPGNAFMSVELKRAADMLDKVSKKHSVLATSLRKKGNDIRKAIYKYGVTHHPDIGRVFAYEVDGYGSNIFMDDANLPSLLALPLLGFIDAKDELYINTRKMVLSRKTNPYYLVGSQFEGIGGPHIGITHAWPLSLLVECMTTDDDAIIKKNLATVLRASAELGLIHESVNVDKVTDYTRSWFAWANSVYAQTILDLAERKPHLIFNSTSSAFE